jgi:hypothetical protein
MEGTSCDVNKFVIPPEEIVDKIIIVMMCIILAGGCEALFSLGLGQEGLSHCPKIYCGQDYAQQTFARQTR